MTFEQFKLDISLLEAIRKLGFEKPMPIQEQAIPPALDGRDILGKAQTGSGKTAAFGLPILQQLLPESSHRPRLLVLAPTRELAQQVDAHLKALAEFTRLHGFSIVGGEDFDSQEHRLRQGGDWVVATPGRLLAHLRRDYADLEALGHLVLDEADRLLELGFLPDIQQIVSYLPERGRQTMLFSATLPARMMELARALLADPVRLYIDESRPPEPVREGLWPVPARQKFQFLQAFLDARLVSSALVFTRTRRRADSLARKLEVAGRACELLHADRSMDERRAALAAFRAGEVPLLVATDLAARGLDISGISHVINYDVPVSPEDYIHRAGRTGRAGQAGEAHTFMAGEEETLVAKIEQYLGKRFGSNRLEDFPYREERPGGRQIDARPREAASYSSRVPGKGRKSSPFTKSGKAKPGLEVPESETRQKNKKRKRRSRLKKRLPHQK